MPARDLHVSTGEALLRQHKYAEARLEFAAALEQSPNNAKLHWQLGVCDDKLGRGHLAIESFQQSIRIDPQFAFGHAAMGAWFLNNGMVDLAADASTRALELLPGNHTILELRARILEVAGEFDAAWKIVRDLFAAGYASPTIIVLFAGLSRRFKVEKTALALLENCLAVKEVQPADAANFHYAAANLLDAAGQFDQAFSHAKKANQIRHPFYDAVAHERTVEELIAYFTRPRLRKFPQPTSSDLPVFIVGMPRSGTTLVEQILASHPLIHGGGELDFMYQIWSGIIGMTKATPQEYPHCLDHINHEQLEGMSQIYLQPLRAMNPQATHITDKLPLNFLHLGLIAMLFPGSRIIHCRRDAMDNCLSCYLTAFREGHDFKYDLKNLGHFYRLYERLMAHWKSELDLPILDVNYEDLITDNAAQSQRMIQFLGIPWDQRCLQFDKTPRPVATASMHQVRRSIYHSSLQRWRNYQNHLGDLKASLGVK
ncbi:MAG TPA: sulfotransferase [Tepidisphaeraceae bacterium]|jgi:tetratricopeptide (TPR) repeat protein